MSKSASVYKVCTEILVCIGNYNKLQYNNLRQFPSQIANLLRNNHIFLNKSSHLKSDSHLPKKMFSLLFVLKNWQKKRFDQKDKNDLKIYDITTWLANNYNTYISVASRRNLGTWVSAVGLGSPRAEQSPLSSANIRL